VKRFNTKENIMTDHEIIALYLSRTESAINETAAHYGNYCSAIAVNILHDTHDAEECVNDAYLSVWNSIPPEKPVKFSSFLGRIVRNIALDRYKARNAKKRGGGENSPTMLLLSELELCIPDSRNVEDEADLNELARIIDSFLAEIKQDDRFYFVRRYWHGYTVPKIARQFNAGESKVKVSLHRTRKKLKIYLEERGISI
jgi:RNA polymerase sigma-70 factor (ECF subfamily)